MRCLTAFALLSVLDLRFRRLVTMPEPERVVPGLDDVAVVRQSIEQCRRHLGVTKHRRPFGERQIGRDNHAGAHWCSDKARYSE